MDFYKSKLQHSSTECIDSVIQKLSWELQKLYDQIMQQWIHMNGEKIAIVCFASGWICFQETLIP